MRMRTCQGTACDAALAEWRGLEALKAADALIGRAGVALAETAEEVDAREAARKVRTRARAFGHRCFKVSCEVRL